MSGERSSDPNDPDYVPSVFAHTTPKEKEDNFERYRCYKRRHESVNASNNSLDKGPGSSKHMVFNNFEQVHETMSDQKIVLQNVQLTYKPALQSHHQQSASPAHYATPAQVTRPAVTVLPQQQNARPPANLLPSSMSYQSKYGELLNVIEDLGREIKPTYAGSKMAQERLKKGIMHARALVRECLAEVEKSARQ